MCNDTADLKQKRKTGDFEIIETDFRMQATSGFTAELYRRHKELLSIL